MARRLCLPILAGALACSPALAQPVRAIQGTEAGVRVSEEALRENPDQVICKSVKVTGSRLDKRRICATAREWAARRDSDRQLAGRLQREMPLPSEVGGSMMKTPPTLGRP